jgi:hypothetical protein
LIKPIKKNIGGHDGMKVLNYTAVFHTVLQETLGILRKSSEVPKRGKGTAQQSITGNRPSLTTPLISNKEPPIVSGFIHTESTKDCN